MLVRSTNSRPPARIVPLRGKLGPLNVPGASLWKKKRPAFTRAAVGLHRYAYWFPVEGRTVRLWIFRSGGCVEARFRFRFWRPPTAQVLVSRATPPGLAPASSPLAYMIASPMSPPSLICVVAGAAQFPNVST